MASRKKLDSINRRSAIVHRQQIMLCGQHQPGSVKLLSEGQVQLPRTLGFQMINRPSRILSFGSCRATQEKAGDVDAKEADGILHEGDWFPESGAGMERVDHLCG